MKKPNFVHIGTNVALERAEMLRFAGSRFSTINPETLGVIAAEIEDLVAERDALLPWAKVGVDVLEDHWPDGGDVDEFDLFEIGKAAGVLAEIPGGFNPDIHFDSNGDDPEPGAPWFEMIGSPFPANGSETENGEDGQ